MPWVATKRIKLGDGKFREPGEVVPEAASWKRVWTDGYCRWVDDDKMAGKGSPKAAPPPVADSPAEPAAPAESTTPVVEEPSGEEPPSVSADVGRLACPECSKTFKTEVTLALHRSRVHDVKPEKPVA